jgi:hypothetical protein
MHGMMNGVLYDEKRCELIWLVGRLSIGFAFLFTTFLVRASSIPLHCS